MRGWQLLGEEKSIFFEGMTLGRFTMLQGDGHISPSKYLGNINCTGEDFKKKKKKEGQTWWHIQGYKVKSCQNKNKNREHKVGGQEDRD